MAILLVDADLNKISEN